MNNSKTSDLLKNNAKSIVDNYKKVISETKLTINELVKKASEVEKLLNSNNNEANDISADIQESNKDIGIKENKRRDTEFIKFDNFRQVNGYIPKIHINKHKDKTLISTYTSDKSYGGVMSFFEKQDAFIPKNYDIKDEEFNFSILKTNEQPNETDYDYKIKPQFFTNRYIEYLYEDRADIIYKDNDNNLKGIKFDKNPNRNNKGELNNLRNDSQYLKIYSELLEKEKEELKNENKDLNQNDILLLSDFNLNLTDLPREGGNPTNKFLNKFIPFAEKRLKSNPDSQNINDIKETKHKNKKDEKKFTEADIAFEIDIQGEITKKIRKGTKKAHLRGMIVNGPKATWYRLNKEKEMSKEKGHFDIRNIDFQDVSGDENLELKDKINKINEESEYEEEFVVKDVIENDKLNKNKTTFTSKKFLEFGNKTYRYFFKQLQDYFLDLLDNISKPTYSLLKFLSDTQCTSVEFNSEHNKSLIEYIYWHPQLQILSIPASFVKELNDVMKGPDWECQLNTLIIKKDNTNDNLEENLNELFKLKPSITIQNLHFIDVSYNQKFFDTLLVHIYTFYKEEIDTEDPKQSIYLNYRKNKLPIINLSCKKALGSEVSSKIEDELKLENLYYLLMYMLICALEESNGTLPEVFNKLDLSESIVSENIDYLVKIITKFKIIKELDISNTRLQNKKLLEVDFLNKICLTKNFEEVFDQHNFYETLKGFKKSVDVYVKKYYINNEKKRDEYALKPEYLKGDSCFDYSMGILPILEKIYIYYSDIKGEAKANTAKEIYNMFKKLKFFRGVYYSEQPKSNQENSGQGIYLSEEIAERINNDKKTYCENIFHISND